MSWLVPQAKCWYQMLQCGDGEPLFREAVVLQIPTTQCVDIQVTLNQEKLSVPLDMVTIRSFNPESITTQQDMVKMPILNEAEILNNTFVRFRRDEIYTYIGPTLLVINPYKQLKMFDQSMIAKMQKAVFSGPTFESLEPHIYEVSGLAFKLLMNSEKRQAIVISGESGAGKTEQAKYSMRFLTSLSEAKHNKSSRRNGVQLQGEVKQQQQAESPIEDRILQCNPILEAFGNSKTVRNDNSSRFGKYVRIQVNGQKIVGATIMNYLLEKSRVCSQQPGERNYHIFYLMLNQVPPGQLAAMGLINSPIDKVEMGDYPYLQFQKGELTASFLSMFDELQQSFQKTGFEDHEVRSLYSILAAILHLGGVCFDDTGFDENSTACSLKNPIKLQMVSQLLGIPFKGLSKYLVYKIRSTPTTQIESPIRINECQSKRDAFAKFLYDKIFTWLVGRLNASISGKEYSKSIGLLDIFGFESFVLNSFEQLCINYTNERLQQLYVNYVFKREQQEFIEDGLQSYLSVLQFSDNQQIIQLLDGQMSLFSLLDEECMLKNGNDESFLGKAQKSHQKHPYFQTSLSKGTFLIHHTQSQVVYQASNFVQKNRDEANKELEDAMALSSNPVIASIFTKSLTKQSKTLGANFRKEMAQLMQELGVCEVHFIRCIKPNQIKQRDNFIWTYVLQQIKYLGVLDSINVRKQTYPNRIEYVEFYKQFREVETSLTRQNGSLEQMVLLKLDFRLLVQNLLTIIFPEQDPQFILYGAKRVYLKKEYMSVLDDRMLERFKLKCISARLILRSYRIHRFRKRLLINLKSFLKATKLITRKLRRQYLKLQRKKMKALLEVMEFIRKLILHEGYIQIQDYGRMKLKRRKLNQNSKRYSDGFNKLTLWMLKNGYYTIKQAYQYALFNQQQQLEQLDSSSMLHQDDYTNLIIDSFVYENIEESLEVSFLPTSKPPKELPKKPTNQINTTVESKKPLKEQPQEPSKEIKKITQPAKELFQSSNQSITQIPTQQPKDSPKQNNQTNFFTQKANFQTQDPNIGYDSKQIDYLTTGLKAMKLNKIEYPDHFELPYQEPLVNVSNFFNITLKAMDNKLSQSKDPPYSEDREFQFSSISIGFIQMLNQFDLFTWAEGRLRKQKSFFGMTLTAKQILSSSQSPIKQSLLIHTSPYYETRACDFFKNLLILMKEAFSPQLFILLNNVINECLTADQNFIDEVFLQMIRLIHLNKKRHYLLRICHIFSVIAYCSQPSQYLCMALMNFFMCQQAIAVDQEEEQYYRYIFVRMTKKMQNPGQVIKEVPPNNQIISIMTQRQIWVPIFVCTGGTVVIWADSHETIDQVKTKALHKMGINVKRVPMNFFGIFEIINKQSELQERMLSGNALAWNVLARWQDKRELDSKEAKDIPIFILMLKIIYPFEYTPDDFLTKQLIFSQIFYDLFTGRFIPQEGHIDELVYILHSTRGLTLNIGQCLPFLPKNRFNQKFAEFQTKEQPRKQTEFMSLEESQVKFFSIARSYHQFLCIFFRVKYSLNKIFINDQLIYLGLKPFRILIFKEGVSEAIHQFTFDQITKWGASEKYIKFHTHDGQVHLCETEQAPEIAKYIQDCSIIFLKLTDIKSKRQNNNYTSTNVDLYLNGNQQTKKLDRIEKMQLESILETIPEQDLKKSLIKNHHELRSDLKKTLTKKEV